MLYWNKEVTVTMAADNLRKVQKGFLEGSVEVKVLVCLF